MYVIIAYLRHPCHEKRKVDSPPLLLINHLSSLFPTSIAKKYKRRLPDHKTLLDPSMLVTYESIYTFPIEQLY